MEKRPVISVIVPVYKVERWLDACVTSVLEQTFADFELLLIDDGSPDRCGEMCDQWATKDARIRVYHKPNGGLSDARNYGLDRMKGAYVTFVDSDDTIDSQYLQFLYDCLMQHDQADYSECNYIAERSGKLLPNDESGVLLKLSAGEAFERVLYHDHLTYAACAKLFRREIFSTLRFPVGRIYEEMYMIGEFLKRSRFVVYGGKSLYHYVIRENSITTSKFGRHNVQQMMEAANHVCDLAVSMSQELLPAAKRFQSYVWMRMIRSILESSPTDQSETLLLLRKKTLGMAVSVFCNPQTPNRDRMGILALIPGVWFFGLIWRSYLKLRLLGKTDIGGSRS